MYSFISYSHNDRLLANRINELLLRRGIESWIDQNKIGAGDVLTATIKKQLDKTDLFVILFTKNISDWRNEEFNYIWPRISEGKVRLLPFVFPGSVIPEQLKEKTHRFGNCSSEESMNDINEVINFGLKVPDLEIPMSQNTMQKRLKQRKAPEYGIRLIPTDQFNQNATLGSKEREYVFIADYFEQCGRTLGTVKSNLFSDVFDWAAATEKWTAIIFRIGEVYQKQYDLFPGTWKSVFRILSDKKRLGIINASAEDYELIKKDAGNYHNHDDSGLSKKASRKYNYYGDDDYFFSRVSRSLDKVLLEESTGRIYLSVLQEKFGIQSSCFEGNGLAIDGASRIFLIKNLPVKELNYRRQDLGHEDDGAFLT